MSTKVIEVSFDDPTLVQKLYGPHDDNLKRIEKELGISIAVRGEMVRIQGEENSVDLAYRLLEDLYQILLKGIQLYPADVDCSVRMLKRHPGKNLKDVFMDVIYLSPTKRRITPKSLGQKRYIDAIRAYEKGLATKEDIDAGVKLGLNHPMGPLSLTDLVGLDTTYHIACAMYEDTADPKYAPPILLKQMVTAGWMGRKSGKGFYDYSS